jgi:hypothetical protein
MARIVCKLCVGPRLVYQRYVVSSQKCAKKAFFWDEQRGLNERYDDAREEPCVDRLGLHVS